MTTNRVIKQAYKEAIASANEAYNEATAPARKAYHEAITESGIL